MKFKISISKRELYITLFGAIIFLLCFSNKVINSYFPLMYVAQKYGKVVIIAILFLLMANQDIKKLSWTFVVLTAFMIWETVVTFIKSGSLSAMFTSFSSMFLIIMTLELLKNNKSYVNIVLRIWEILILLIVLIDIYTEIKYKKGLYVTGLSSKNWFLGYKTERVIYSFPLVVISSYLSLDKKGTISLSVFLYTMIACINVVLSEGTAAGIMFLVLFVTMLIWKLINDGKAVQLKKFLTLILNYKFIILIYAIINVLVVFTPNSEFASFISEYFGKRAGFSGRVIIWVTCIKAIMKSPVMGTGYILSTDFVRLVGNNAATNAHNMILQILMFGGFVALLIYLILVISVIKKPQHGIGEIYGEDIFKMLIYAIFLLGITSAVYVFSPFGMLAYWMFEYYKNDKRRTQRLQKSNK